LYRLLFYLSLVSIGRAESGDAASEAQRARISLGEVTSIVLANNPAIQQALRKWGAAKARVTQEGAWDDLRVSGSSRVARFVDVAPNAFTDQMLSVEQIIPLTGKNLLRGRVAAADAVAAFEQARREQLDALAKTRASYFRLASAYAQLELNRKNLVSLRQIAEVSRSRYEVGKANAAEPLEGEVEASKVEAQRYNDSRQAASELDAGVSFTVPWVNPGKYSAAVREAKENLAAAEHGLDQTKAESLGLLRNALQKVHTAKHHVELFRD